MMDESGYTFDQILAHGRHVFEGEGLDEVSQQTLATNLGLTLEQAQFWKGLVFLPISAQPNHMRVYAGQGKDTHEYVLRMIEWIRMTWDA